MLCIPCEDMKTGGKEVARRRSITTTKYEIIQVASEFFLNKGVSQTSPQMIAAELDMSTGNITYYFKNKEHLLAVFVVGGNVGIHHRLNGFLLGIAVLVKVVVIHIKGTVTTKAEAEPLGKHHSLGVFELVIGIPQMGVKLALYI